MLGLWFKCVCVFFVDVGDGFKIVMYIFNNGRFGMVVVLFGIMKGFIMKVVSSLIFYM